MPCLGELTIICFAYVHQVREKRGGIFNSSSICCVYELFPQVSMMSLYFVLDVFLVYNFIFKF